MISYIVHFCVQAVKEFIRKIFSLFVDLTSFFVCIYYTLFCQMVCLATDFLHMLIRLSPFHQMYQYVYLRSTFLQSVLSFRLCDKSFNFKHNDPNIEDLSAELGINVEHHLVRTEDDYLLGLQRLRLKNINASIQTKGTILIIHGSFQDSESFLCSGTSSLGSLLCHEGYDVWLGNNRGTKYSFFHETFNSDTSTFWDFCVDDMGIFDFPSMLKYVLKASNQSKIKIIGYSQGASQIFLGLAIYPELCNSVKCFVSLAAALSSKTAGHSFIHSFVKYNYVFCAFLLRFIFGDKSMVQVTLLLKNTMSRKLFCTMCSIGFYFVMGWKFKNISMSRRINLFQYIFSEISVKCVLHWIQFDNTTQLSHFNHHLFPSSIYQNTLLIMDGLLFKTFGIHFFLHPHQKIYSNRIVDLSTITTPVLNVVGSLDGLVNPTAVVEKVNCSVQNEIIRGYEHLDIIWSDDFKQSIFPKISTFLNQYHNNCCDNGLNYEKNTNI